MNTSQQMDENDIYSRISSLSPTSHIETAEEQTDIENVSLSASERFEKFRLMVSSSLNRIVIHAIWIAVGLNLVWRAVSIVMAVAYLDTGFLDWKAFDVIFWLFLPFVTWMVSTAWKYWNYERRKIFCLGIAFFSVILFLAQLFVTLSITFLVPLVMSIPINRDLTASMVISLAWLVTALMGIIPGVAAGYSLLRMLFDPDNRKMIIYFRLFRHTDFRKGKKYKYDLKIVKEKESGKIHVVKEDDRTLHLMADGSSGTGKTSSTLTPAITDDLDQKIYNDDALKKIFLRLVKKGDVILKDDFEDIDFCARHFVPVTKRGRKKFNRYSKMIISAGLTAMAPNSAFGDEIYDLCISRGIRVNRIDPVLVNGKHKPGFTGFNPLYINPELKGLDRKIEIFAKATMFADVCQAIYEANGKGDPYFTSLNRNISTSIVILLELTFETLEHRQPNPSDVQEVINDFSRSNRYLTVLKERQDRAEYQYIIDLVEYELLGEGAVKLTEQARGLRVLINELLTHPLIKSVLCAENSVDLDRALADGEVTVVNYAIELGQTQGTAFGLFFALSFNNAVLRRPGTSRTRLPHYYYIDEFPLLLHPRFEQCFTLFRQYKCALAVALQTLDLMDKSELTRFMKTVLVANTATQIYFGRLGVQEMEMLEKLGGKHDTVLEQRTISEQALSVENTSLSYSTRSTKQKANLYEGADVRYKDFQEVTMVTVENGDALLPFAGTVDFLEKHRRKRVKRYRVDWHKYYDAEKAAKYLAAQYGQEQESVQAEEQPVGTTPSVPDIITDSSATVTIMPVEVPCDTAADADNGQTDGFTLEFEPPVPDDLMAGQDADSIVNMEGDDGAWTTQEDI